MNPAALTRDDYLTLRREPLVFGKLYWPETKFYDKQREIIYSVQVNKETYVVAGTELGKDFVAAFIILWFFLTHHPVRVVTTSATERHLNVLWGEMDRYLRTAKYPLTSDKGGPIVYNQYHITKVMNGKVERDSYVVGVVASSTSRGEGLSGHHAAYTLGVVDEASGTTDVVYNSFSAWADRILVLGNPYNCENYFRRAVREGDIIAA